MEDTTKAIISIQTANDEFSKLVILAKKTKQEIKCMQEKTGLDMKSVISKIKNCEFDNIKCGDDEMCVFNLLRFYTQKKAEAEAFKKVYKNLLEEPIEELLMKMNISGESYDYDFFTFCIEN